MEAAKKFNWKPFGPNVWLGLIELRPFSEWASSEDKREIKHAFIHAPCPMGKLETSPVLRNTYNIKYGIFLDSEYDILLCNYCGAQLPEEAKKAEDYVNLMNAVKKYKT